MTAQQHRAPPNASRPGDACDREAVEEWVRQGSVRGGEHADVAAHVEACDACAAEAAWLRHERRLFVGRPPAVAPLPPFESVEERMRVVAASPNAHTEIASPRERASWRAAALGGPRAWLGGLAAAAALSLVLAGVLRDGPPDATEGAPPSASEAPFQMSRSGGQPSGGDDAYAFTSSLEVEPRAAARGAQVDATACSATELVFEQEECVSGAPFELACEAP